MSIQKLSYYYEDDDFDYFGEVDELNFDDNDSGHGRSGGFELDWDDI